MADIEMESIDESSTLESADEAVAVDMESGESSEPQESEQEQSEVLPQNVATGVESGALKYTCDVCPYQTNHAYKMRAHMSSHTYEPGSKFKCPYCPYYSSVIPNLCRHMRLHPEHKDRYYSIDDAEIKINPENVEQGRSKVVVRQSKDVVRQSKDVGRRRADFRPTPSKCKFTCNICPFICRSRQGLQYHKQFHTHKPSAQFKCSHCPYWVDHKHMISHHERVHSPSYGVSTPLFTKSVMSSPAKSEVFDDIDSVEMATLKQQIINSKIRSCPLTPEKFTPIDTDSEREGKMEIEEGHKIETDQYTIPGYVVDDKGQVLKMGVLRKLHKCSQCPYAHVKGATVKMHEAMHVKIVEKEKEKEMNKEGEENVEKKETEEVVIYTCEFCSYNTTKKKLRATHIQVHSQQYEPGRDNILDFADPDAPADSTDTENTEDDDAEKDTEVTFAKRDDVEKAEDPIAKKSENSTEKSEELIIKRPLAMKPDVNSGPRIESGQIPTEFYLKFNEESGKHILERVTVQKFNCDRCPYATFARLNFERHITLHGTGQPFDCEFCDYSVPTQEFLSEHRKLHLMPNPNLLSMQSLSNLSKLPEMSADVAAAADFPVNKDDPISKEGVHDYLSLYENSEDFYEPKVWYRCDRCPFMTTQKFKLLSHLKYHMMKSALQCSYCDFSLPDSKRDFLTQHMKTHFANELHFELLSDRSEIDLVKSENDLVKSENDLVKSENNVVKSLNDVVKSVKSEQSSDNIEKATAQDNDMTTNTSQDSVSTLENGEQAYETISEKPEGCNMEYIDYSELLAQEDSNNNGLKEEKDQEGLQFEKTELKLADDVSCVCQYCDRLLQNPEGRVKHEKQHLIGQKC